MTLGFAVAAWEKGDVPLVGVVADSRLSNSGSTLSDMGVKTYELGGRCAMVAAGHALPALTAAEIVRPLVENHNRRNSKPLGFYDTVRLLSFFLKKSAQDARWSCEVVVAGFLQSGRPCLAHVIVSPNANRVRFSSAEERESLIIPVGNREASRFLLQGLSAAREQSRPRFVTGISLLWYMSRHPGAFPSVGGGLSVGSCERSAQHFSWLHVEIEGRRFLRGIDLTDYVRPQWPPPQVINYDESWCAALDLSVHRDQVVTEPTAVSGGGYDIDSLSTPESLFQLHDDPVAFDNGLARQS